MALRLAVALVASLLVISQVEAGVKTGKHLDGPYSGVFPAACMNGVNESANGAPSNDLLLSSPKMIKTVTGNEPEQIHLSMGHTPRDMYVSWATGDANYYFCEDGVQDGSATNQCFFGMPKAIDTGSVVKYSTDPTFKNPLESRTSGSIQTQQYTYYYGPIGRGTNYTSPVIHHILLTNLKPSTTYYYKVGDDTTMSPILTFTTLPLPGSQPRPIRIAMTADLGTTHATAEVLRRFTEGNKPDIVFLPGDHVYADNHNDDQRYWDAWFRLLSPSTQSVPWMVNAGNHEEETQWTECIANALSAKNASCGTPEFIMNNCPSTNGSCPCQDDRFGGEKGSLDPVFVWNHCHNDSAFTSFNARWAVPYQETNSPSNKYYTFKFGLVQAFVLSGYEPYCGGELPCSIYTPGLNVGPDGNSPQYKWLANHLAKLNRTETPWVIVYFHNPWYTSWGGFKTDDCPRQALEPLLKAANVDLFFNGHIHAYERSNPVFNLQADSTNTACNPVHIVIGDAGNDETLNCATIDRGTTDENGFLDCAGQQIAYGATEGYYFPCTSHTFQDNPQVCKKDDPRVQADPIPPSFYGCQEDGYCPNKQPNWSAYRAAAYGSGLLEIINATTASWTWKGFYKTEPNGVPDTGAEVNTIEQTYFYRC